MDFNIRDMLKKKQALLQQSSPEGIIAQSISDSGFTLEVKNINYIKGVISLKNISPLKRTAIKMKKKSIINNLLKKDIQVRDII